MFEEIDPPQGKQPTDWTGTKIGGALLPVFFFFVYLGKAELGFTVILVTGMILLAIKLHWRLRKHAWFWVTITVVLALHVPLFFMVRWPDTKVPTIAYSMPFGIADFLIISAVLRIAENLFSRDSADDEEE